MTITEFLLARIAEDEDEARRAEGLPSGMRFWSDNPGGAFDPARVLAECEAKRRIVALHAEYEDFGDCSTCGDVPQVEWPCDTLLAFAYVYADHPDFREEWRA